MIRTGGGDGVRVWVATAPVDMRKGFDGLAEVVRAFLGHDPLGGHMFVFRNRSSQRVKVLWWDKNGLAISTTQYPRESGSYGLVPLASPAREGGDDLLRPEARRQAGRPLPPLRARP